MLIGERHRAILEMLAQAGSITTGEIQKRFGVGYDSAKRDLRILEEKGLLKRTHGGAIMMRGGGGNGRKPEGEGGLLPRSQNDRHLRIAKRAIAEIAPQEVIYVTAGDMGDRMAQNMPEDRIFTVVTDSAAVAGELRTRGNITVILAGKEMEGDGAFEDGFLLEMESLKCLHFDKCFITSACISLEFGLSAERTEHPEALDAVIRNSRKVYGLYPVEKIGTVSEVRVCGVGELDVLITDEGVPEEVLRGFKEAGVEVVVAGE